MFQRVGEGTDVVTKEMYDFEDKGGRRLALRPEGTASVVRAYSSTARPIPWKVWYAAPTLPLRAPAGRALPPAPPAGRRGARLGGPRPRRRGHRAGLATSSRTSACARSSLLINSMGEPAGPGRLRRRARRPTSASTSTTWPKRTARRSTDHPLRVLDSKRPETAAVVGRRPRSVRAPVARPPRPTSTGCRPASTPSASPSRSSPGWCGASTTTPAPPSSSQAEALDAAQNAVGGGGRYDGLAEALGGPPTPGIGFGMGIERILLAVRRRGGVARRPTPPVDVFVVDVTGGDVARDLTVDLRRAGLRRRPGLRRPLDEVPDEGGRPQRAPASPSSWARTRRPRAWSPSRDRCAATATQQTGRRPTT